MLIRWSITAIGLLFLATLALDAADRIGSAAGCLVLYAAACGIKVVFILGAVLIPLVLGLAARDALCESRSLPQFGEILADLAQNARAVLPRGSSHDR